jgi:exopolysaccharide biosynthesis protein
LHFVWIDLRDPSISIRVFRGGDDPDGAGTWQTTLATPSVVAQREQLDVAVNGNFFWGKNTLALLGRKTPYFPGNWACAVGWAMSDGKLWSAQPSAASLLVDASGRLHIGRYDRIPEDARQVVSGSQLLVVGGRNISSGMDVAPRTAAGVTGDGNALVLLVVDGRRPEYSAGLTFGQLADEMIRMGCSDALNLDGGGSSTLVLRDQTTGKLRLGNRPSDGHDLLFPLSIERPVADVLGIRCVPSGQIVHSSTRP